MKRPNFTDLVDRHYSMLYRFALGLSCDEATASDLTQQSLSLWALKRNLLCDDAQAKSRLLAEIYGQFRKDDRHAIRFTQPECPAQDDVQPCGALRAVDVLEPGEVMECLQSINEILRVPLLLFYLGDQSSEEIAEILTIPPEIAMLRLSVGKRELQSALLRRLEAAGTASISMEGRPFTEIFCQTTNQP